MIISGNRSQFTTRNRKSTVTGRTLLLEENSAEKRRRRKRQSVLDGEGGILRAGALLLEVGAFLLAPESLVAETGIGFGFTVANAGIDVAINDKVDWTNFGINLATAFIPVLTENKFILGKRIARSEEDLELLVKTAKSQGIELEVLADVEKRVNEIKDLRKLVAEKKLSSREFRRVLQTTNRNVVAKISTAIERKAFRKLPFRLRRLGIFKRARKNLFSKFIGFFGTKKGVAITQLVQTLNPIDFAREIVKYAFYRPLQKIARRFSKRIWDPIRNRIEKKFTKDQLKRLLIKNTLPAIASGAFERFRILSPTTMWVLFTPTNGTYYPPRLINATPAEITEFAIRLSELGDAYSYYRTHFAYSKNGKDLQEMSFGLGAILGRVNVTAYRNLFSTTSNLIGVSQRAEKSGTIPFISSDYWQDVWKGIKRNTERKAGRVIGTAIGGQKVGGKFGTALAKIFFNNDGQWRLSTDSGKANGLNWTILYTAGINTVKSYGIIGLRRRAVTGRSTGFRDSQRFRRVVNVARRPVSQVRRIINGPSK